MVRLLPALMLTAWAGFMGTGVLAAEEVIPAKPAAVAQRFDDPAVTRFELAAMLYPFVRELADKPRGDLAVRASIHSFTDLPTPYRDRILELANQFDLFDQLPGLSPDRFEGTRSMTRGDVSVVLNNFLRLLPESVRQAQLADPRQAFFSDLTQEENVRLTGVRQEELLVGFPDRTFRPDQPFRRDQLQGVERKLRRLVHQARFTRRTDKSAQERRKDDFDYTLLEREF